MITLPKQKCDKCGTQVEVKRIIEGPLFFCKESCAHQFFDCIGSRESVPSKVLGLIPMPTLKEYISHYLEPAIQHGHRVNFTDKWVRLPNYKEIKDWDQNLTVSIVSANWGSTPVLVDHIEGFVKQDYPRDQMEVLFIDDNSPDKNDCIKLMKKLMKKHSDLNIRFFETHKNINWNSTISTNIGIKRAIGDIIVVCDSDVLLVGKDFITATAKHHSQRNSLWLNPLNYEFVYGIHEYRVKKQLRNIEYENFENPSESDIYIVTQPIMWRGGSVRRAECVKLRGLDEGFKGWGGYEGHFYERLKKDGFVGGQDYTMQTMHMWASAFRGQIPDKLFPKDHGRATGNPEGWGEIDTLEEIK